MGLEPEQERKKQKTSAYGCFKELENIIKTELGSKKEEIMQQVKLNTPAGGEPEGTFTKMFLSTAIKTVFPDDIIEGMDSMSKLHFTELFFGSGADIDFLVNKPAKICGEVKYTRLSKQSLGVDTGKLIMLMSTGKTYRIQFQYGCQIFFDTGSAKANILNNEEEIFIRRLWERENIYLIII